MGGQREDNECSDIFRFTLGLYRHLTHNAVRLVLKREREEGEERDEEEGGRRRDEEERGRGRVREAERDVRKGRDFCMLFTIQ